MHLEGVDGFSSFRIFCRKHLRDARGRETIELAVQVLFRRRDPRISDIRAGTAPKVAAVTSLCGIRFGITSGTLRLRGTTLGGSWGVSR